MSEIPESAVSAASKEVYPHLERIAKKSRASAADDERVCRVALEAAYPAIREAVLGEVREAFGIADAELDWLMSVEDPSEIDDVDWPALKSRLQSGFAALSPTQPEPEEEG